MLEELITKGRRVYCLYRVSTLGQVEKDDIPMQKQFCREFVWQHPGWEIVKLIFQKYLCEGYGAQRLCRYLAEQGIQTEKDATYRLLQSTASLRTPFTLGSSEMETANQRCCQSFKLSTQKLMNGHSR